jgi:signal transduction histidine kinase/CheY-like chemotaxis protein
VTVRAKQEALEAPRAGVVRERHVLCVDDDRDFLKSLEFFLPDWINRGSDESRLWYRFLFLDDPHEALKAMIEIVSEGEKVALVISDQMMPAMKGTAFLAESRTHSPVSARALLTGHAGIESAIAAINQRLLDRYLTKPIESEEEFALNIRHLLEEFETRADLQDRNDLIEHLYRFSNQLNAKESLEETIETVLHFASLSLACDRVNIVLSTEGERPWPAGDGDHDNDPEANAPGALVGRARHAREIPGIDADALAQTQGPYAFATLRDRHRVLGLIVASGPQAGQFGDTDLRHLGHLCDTAAIAIGNQLSRGRLVHAWDETRRQAAELEVANGRLRILDKLRGDFLAFISHELRTPLSYFSAMSMLEQARTPEETIELVGFIRRGYERLERFVTKGLDYFGWLGAERVTASAATDVARVTRDVIGRSDLGPSRFTLAIEPRPCWASVEMDHLEEILGVLIDNAAKFSEADQPILVRVENLDAGVRLSVSDRGRGFPREWTSEIFQPFTVVEANHHSEGTALSLAKIAEMVRSYGGVLKAESEGLGRGATFTVELPRLAEGADNTSSSGDGEPPRAVDRAA